MKLQQVSGKFQLTFDPEGEMKCFPFEGQPVLGVPDTVYISGKAFAKTEEAFQAADKAARTAGYDDSITKAEDRHKGTYFSLSEARAAECGSCHSIISQAGVRGHNHKCERCGDPTFLEYTRDGAISLQFLRDGERVGRGPLSFRIFGYREHENEPGELLLFPDPLLKDYAPPRHEKRGWNGLRPGLFGVRNLDEARLILEEAQDIYTMETVHDPVSDKDIKVMVLKDHDPHLVTPKSTFEAHDIVGQIHNHSLIKVFGGQKYGEWDTLPIPDSFDLSRKYIGQLKHSLAEPDIHETILRAAGQVSRTDFYHQDGREAFSDVVYKRMTDFVEHFVDADPQEWAVYLNGAPKDGPGFIRSLAGWSAAMSDGKKRDVRCEPNIGNAIFGMAKLLSGQKLTYEESVAMTEGAETSEADELAARMHRAFKEQRDAEKVAFGRRLEKWVSPGNDNSSDKKDDQGPTNLAGGPG